MLALNSNWADFTIPMGDLNIPVTANTIESIYIDESYGDMLNFAMPSLTSVTTAAAGDELVRFAPRVDSDRRLLEYQNDDRVNFNADNYAVQTATFVFTLGTAGKHAIP